jgi:hypothetical protein
VKNSCSGSFLDASDPRRDLVRGDWGESMPIDNSLLSVFRSLPQFVHIEFCFGDYSVLGYSLPA